MPPRPSYWGESEAREWRRWLREEKEAVERQEKEHRLWCLEEAQRRGYLMDLGPLFEERKTLMSQMGEMKRPPRY